MPTAGHRVIPRPQRRCLNPPGATVLSLPCRAASVRLPGCADSCSFAPTEQPARRGAHAVAMGYSSALMVSVRPLDPSGVSAVAGSVPPGARWGTRRRSRDARRRENAGSIIVRRWLPHRWRCGRFGSASRMAMNAGSRPWSWRSGRRPTSRTSASAQPGKGATVCCVRQHDRCVLP
jgi:hypothetical protein